MARHVVERLVQGALVIFLISVATFLMMRLIPGCPVMLMLGEGQLPLTAEQIDAILAMWGLDRPYHEQYFVWVGNLIRGEMGESIVRIGVPVRDMVFEAASFTAKLNVWALMVSLLIAIPAGIIAAVKRNSIFDYIATSAATFGIAVPHFWYSLVLIIIFSLFLGWFPPFGAQGWESYVLPVVVLATGQAAVFARVMRGSLLEVLHQDYVRTAYAKGLTSRAVIVKHAVRNALLAVVTVIGFRVAFILSGTIVVETIFAFPGIGRLFTESIFYLDYQVVQSLVMVFAVLVVVINLITDLTYAFIDPRIRVE
jgi:ABC-type dipeptide/oligopeptide/nickel transport system permease component